MRGADTGGAHGWRGEAADGIAEIVEVDGAFGHIRFLDRKV